MIAMMRREDAWKECCCGHKRFEHRSPQLDPTGSCSVCGGISCPKFHEVGEGHRPALFLMFLALLIITTVCSCITIYRRTYGQIHAHAQ